MLIAGLMAGALVLSGCGPGGTPPENPNNPQEQNTENDGEKNEETRSDAELNAIRNAIKGAWRYECTESHIYPGKYSSGYKLFKDDGTYEYGYIYFKDNDCKIATEFDRKYFYGEYSLGKVNKSNEVEINLKDGDGKTFYTYYKIQNDSLYLYEKNGKKDGRTPEKRADKLFDLPYFKIIFGKDAADPADAILGAWKTACFKRNNEYRTETLNFYIDYWLSVDVNQYSDSLCSEKIGNVRYDLTYRVMYATEDFTGDYANEIDLVVIKKNDQALDNNLSIYKMFKFNQDQTKFAFSVKTEDRNGSSEDKRMNTFVDNPLVYIRQ